MYIPENLFLKKTNRGRGLFTRRFIQKDEVVAQEKGYYLGGRDEVGVNCIQISKDVFLDYKNHPHYLDFINHSCNPNMQYDTTKFAFYAICNIETFEEITYDYETTEKDLTIDNTDFNCLCSSKNCKKYINGCEK